MQLKEGFSNLKRHIKNTLAYGIPVVVAVNQFSTDTEAELKYIQEAAKKCGAFDAVVCNVRPPPPPCCRSGVHTQNTRACADFIGR